MIGVAFFMCLPGPNLRAPTLDPEASLLENAARRGKREGLMQRLEDDWSGRHKLVPSQKGVSMASTPFNRSPCLQHGLCICAGRGQLAHQFHGNLVASVKPFVRAKAAAKAKAKAKADPLAAAKKKMKPPARLLMEESRLILELRVKSQKKTKNFGEFSGWEALAAQFAAASAQVEDDAIAWESVADSLWLHLGYANFKVYDFTFLKLELLDAECLPDGEVVLHVPDGELDTSRSRLMLADLVDFERP